MTDEIHPLATIFPQIVGDAFNELVADIKANGLREPIIRLDGKILDGRNRAIACRAAGVEPRFEEWQPAHDGDTPQAFVISRNLARRHLNESERAMIAARLVSNPYSKSGPKTTAGNAATALNVSIQQVQRGRRLLKMAIPELMAKVDAGEMSVRGASDIAKLPPEEQRAALAIEPVETRGGVRPPRQRDEAKAESFVDEINAWIDATAERRHDIRELSPDQRVAVAKRFMCLMCASRACRSLIGPPTHACELPQREWKPAQHLVSVPGSAKPPAPKPADTEDAVAAFLAAGGKIERMPSACSPTPEERAALAAHHEEREAARRSKFNSPI